MKTKQIGILLSICLILAMTLTACQSYMSYSFDIENGDTIKVTLNTSDGYQLSQKDGSITVSKDGKDVLSGYFLTADTYEAKVALVTSSSVVDMISATPKDAPTLYVYQNNEDGALETDFLFQIKGTHTGAILGSYGSRKDAEAAFQLLTFKKAN